MCYCEDDGPRPEFYRVKKVKARKDHLCVECSAGIKTGGFYEAAAGKWDKDCLTFRTCASCLELREQLLTVCGGFSFGMLREDLDSHGLLSISAERLESGEWFIAE